jgi:hypothetical protein
MRSVLHLALGHRDLVVLLLAGEVESRLALDDAWFRIGPDQLSTPTLHLDAVAGSRALLAECTSCPDYRAFTL